MFLKYARICGGHRATKSMDAALCLDMLIQRLGGTLINGILESDMVCKDILRLCTFGVCINL